MKKKKKQDKNNAKVEEAIIAYGASSDVMGAYTGNPMMEGIVRPQQDNDDI